MLKGICILFVIITHHDWSDAQRMIGGFPFWIDMAVPIFMMISGYVYSNSFLKNNINLIECAYDLNFIIPKIIRYTLPFIIAFVVELIPFMIFKDIGILSIGKAFLTGGFGPGSYYYPVMIQFVLFFPVIFHTMKNNPKKGLIFWFVANGFYEVIQRAYGLPTETYRLLILRYVFLIAFGTFVYFSKEKSIKNYKLIIIMIIGLAYIFIVKYIGYETKILNNVWKGTNFLSALYIIPIFYFMVIHFSKLNNKFFSLLGKASYNIYLVQMVYYPTISKVVYKYISFPILQILIHIIICSVCGICFYLIELRITNRFISKIKNQLGNKY